jgi:hypothetical protein
MTLEDLIKRAYKEAVEAAKNAKKAEEVERQEEQTREENQEFNLGNFILSKMEEFKQVKNDLFDKHDTQINNIEAAKNTLAGLTGQALLNALPEFERMIVEAEETEECAKVVDKIIITLWKAFEYLQKMEKEVEENE